MREIRPGYYTEQSRKDSYLDILNDPDKMNNQYRLIVTRLENFGAATMQEIDDVLGLGVHVISARLNEMRKLGIVENPTEWITDKKTGTKKLVAQKRFYPPTKKRNTLWALAGKSCGQLKIF